MKLFKPNCDLNQGHFSPTFDQDFQWRLGLNLNILQCNKVERKFSESLVGW